MLTQNSPRTYRCALRTFQLTLLLILAIASQAFGQLQSPNNRVAAVSIFVKDSIKMAQKGLKLTLMGTKDSKKIKLTTNDKGLAEVLLKRGQDYMLYLKGADEFDLIPAGMNSSKQFVFYVEYDKKSKSHPAKNPLSYLNIQPTTTRELIDIHAKDFIGETVTFIQKSSGRRTFVEIKESGENKLLLKKGQTFAVEFQGYRIIDSLYYAIGPSLISLRLDLNRKHFERMNGRDIRDFDTEVHEWFSENSSPQGDNILHKVFARNKWRDAFVVMDLTGSMAPCVHQLATWHALYSQKRDHEVKFVFFNDGDNKDDTAKVIGSAGGLYFSNGEREHLEKTIVKCIKNGNGGDGPENDLEALLLAIEKGGAKEFVLVVDNHSPVRDLVLLEKINVPIRVVLCGSDLFTTHPDYLKIAFKTGGSVHTIENDILDLSANISEDGIIKIGEEIYRLEQDVFIRQ